MRISPTERATNYLVLFVFAVLALFPLLGVLVAALGHDPGAPGGLANVRQAWTEGHFGVYLRNSVVVSAVVVTVSTVLSILAGFAFATMRLRGAGVLFNLMLLGIMMPAEAVVVPLYFDLQNLHLTDTYWGIMLPQMAQSVAFGTYWLRAFFRGSNRSLIEAARLDGATTWQILWRILVPTARPAIVTLVVLTTMWTWNEFLIPLVMVPSNDGLRTAPLGLSFFQGQYTQGFTLLAAGSVIIALPIVIVYLFLQRHFIAGMLEGAVKD